MQIFLKNIKIFAFHGVYEEERILGTWYKVNIKMTSKDARAEDSDEVAHALNYEMIHDRARTLFCERSFSLLEACAKYVGEHLIKEFQRIEKISVQIEKYQVPMHAWSGESVGVIWEGRQ